MHWSRNRLKKSDLGMVHKWAVAWFINCGVALQCKMTHLASSWESFFTFSFSHPKVLSPGKKNISQIAWNNTLSVLAVKAISAPCKWREYPIHNQHIMLLSKAKLENFKNNHCLMSDYHGVWFWEPRSLLWGLYYANIWKTKLNGNQERYHFPFLLPAPPFFSCWECFCLSA